MVSFGVHLELWNQFTTFVMAQSYFTTTYPHTMLKELSKCEVKA